MTKALRLATVMAAVLLVLGATSVFASVPSVHWGVTTSMDTVANTLTWNVTNLTDDSSGFKLVRMDWLYPIYDVENVVPGAPWTFRTYQLAPDDWIGGYSTTAVSWMTDVANGLGNGDAMGFTIHSIPPVVDQEPLPLHLVWQRLRADTPAGEPTTIDIGVVPEPSGLLMLACGITGMGGMLLRRRK